MVFALHRLVGPASGLTAPEHASEEVLEAIAAGGLAEQVVIVESAGPAMVFALHRLVGPASGLTAPEHASEEVLEAIAAGGLAEQVVIVESAGPATCEAAIHTCKAEAVVVGAFLFVTQHFVGFVDFLEFVLGIRFLVDIRMIFHGELAFPLSQSPAFRGFPFRDCLSLLLFACRALLSIPPVTFFLHSPVRDPCPVHSAPADTGFSVYPQPGSRIGEWKKQSSFHSLVQPCRLYESL